jgi:Arylsulfotransferase (ASST)
MAGALRARRAVAAAAALSAVSLIALGSAGTPAMVSAAPQRPAVSVYPTPGDRYELPHTQISFRGIAPSKIGSVVVVGSRTGAHAGLLVAHSDGNGASLVFARPFAPGERVTVTTGLNVIGASNGTFSFGIEHPGPPLPGTPLPRAKGSGGVQRFRTNPGLRPAAVLVTKNRTPASDGDIFVAPQFGPQQNGPMIVDPNGNLVWFEPFPVSQSTLVTDFRVQHLFGQKVLTWWQGSINTGSGRGYGVILDQHYRQIATVQAANGVQMDLHEFLVTNQGQAWIIAIAPMRLPGVRRTVQNGVVQEIDIKTGLVLFQWDSMDHVPPSSSYRWGPKIGGRVLGPWHINSISLDTSGNPVISMRNTNAVYDIERSTGRINWQLGGKHSSFRMGPGTSTAFQHDAIIHPDFRRRRRSTPRPRPVAGDPRRGQHQDPPEQADPGVPARPSDLLQLRGEHPDAPARQRVPRLGPAAVLLAGHGRRSRGLQRPLQGRDYELPGLPVPVERSARDPARPGRGHPPRRLAHRVRELERRHRCHRLASALRQQPAEPFARDATGQAALPDRHQGPHPCHLRRRPGARGLRAGARHLRGEDAAWICRVHSPSGGSSLNVAGACRGPSSGPASTIEPRPANRREEPS